MTQTYDPFSSQSVERELVRRYRIARMVWRSNSGIRDAAATLMMSERAYCDAFLRNFEPLVVQSHSSPVAMPDANLAFEEAGRG